MGDGELQEGQIWEATLYAAANKVDNLIAIVERNHQQIDGTTEDVLPLGNLRAKFEGFDWHVLETDGNSFETLLQTHEQAKVATGKGKPIIILMHTGMGHGVDFMTGSHKWHGVAPNDEQLEQAFAQLPETLGDYSLE